MQPLILLKDFDHWFQQLPLRLPGVSRQQFEPLRQQLVECLSQIVEVQPAELASLRELTEKCRKADEFILTLDGGIYFHEADFSFAMTRAVTRLTDTVRGRMIRVAREGYGQFWTQVSILRREYEGSGKRVIVVCDDGIDTGKSLAEVVRQLNEQYLEVSGIRVLLNPNNLLQIEGVPIDTITEQPAVLWTHERDLFWGSPTGGVSLITRDNVNQLGGVPYSLTAALLKKRLGLEDIEVDSVRVQLLDLNREFWSLLSRAAGRSLRLRDCKRLLWATEFDEFDDRSLIVDVIAYLRDKEPKL